MRSWLSRLRGVRLDPVAVDRLLAVVLTAWGALIDAWLGHDAAHHRIATALVATLVTGSVAIRRRYPALVGTVVPIFAAANFAVWHGPQFVGYPIANACALYALAVWTPPRRFAVGMTLVVAAFLATGAAPGGSLRGALPFTVVTAVVMLLVRRVVGDRERRAQMAERERDVAAREAVVEERARIARELHDVIAHHVSMMVLQAGAERRGLGDEQASTREVLETVERTGRSALDRDAPPARHAARRCATTRSARSPGSTTCRPWSTSSVRPGFRWSCASRASRAGCRPGSSSRPTGSSRRH